jgi:GNAT superfamily N-acetyltransferase
MNAPPNIHIRETNRQDVPLILRFVQELAEYEKLSHRVAATEQRLENTLFGETAFAKAVLAFQNDQAVAFAIYFFNFSSFVGLPGLYVEDIYVRPAFRGHGIGKHLLRFLARKAVEAGCVRMEWAVLNWNESAISFYLKLGAVPMDDWRIFRLANQEFDTLVAD